MSDHAHDDHPLPPPEPDALPLGRIVFWGVGCFVATVVCIIALGSYFWLERQAEDVDKVMGFNAMEAQVAAQAEAEAKSLKSIDKAMQTLAGQGEIK